MAHGPGLVKSEYKISIFTPRDKAKPSKKYEILVFKYKPPQAALKALFERNRTM